MPDFGQTLRSKIDEVQQMLKGLTVFSTLRVNVVDYCSTTTFEHI